MFEPPAYIPVTAARSDLFRSPLVKSGASACGTGRLYVARATSSLRSSGHRARVRPLHCSSGLRMLLRGFPNPGAFNSDGKRRIIEELVQFPTEFEFKVVGLRQGDFTDDVVGLVAGALQRAENLDVRNTTSRDDRVRITKVRDRGKYRSLTIVAFCETGAQVYSVYEALERDPRVLFKF
ncbi:hypothetical protein CYME_CMH139C [Cyanidioschyzon merolae strain 10D]|jgi:putative lipoic acid-binding regulatory protein|uniref:Uncharacterized protein n=1 Tax=Cyanidioschyzon merolae (strain NIES-3377 / 10D) TaxID=280699 RepID=M1V501_CYAM1|nr:hypothetical protein CYME_CMH139C [Cyanidioschyzon merolae strain 10D]BAM79810.1 hypothetical protein CYME_CMH139C [Cyanidioschyzon merolae strain 10D]|eukprot:XP_005536096.1 hypothetical protein CYME_CMH139C [Cyanidioschyzon merolae strain 10D]